MTYIRRNRTCPRRAKSDPRHTVAGIERKIGPPSSQAPNELLWLTRISQWRPVRRLLWRGLVPERKNLLFFSVDSSAVVRRWIWARGGRAPRLLGGLQISD